MIPGLAFNNLSAPWDNFDENPQSGSLNPPNTSYMVEQDFQYTQDMNTREIMTNIFLENTSDFEYQPLGLQTQSVLTPTSSPGQFNQGEQFEEFKQVEENNGLDKLNNHDFGIYNGPVYPEISASGTWPYNTFELTLSGNELQQIVHGYLTSTETPLLYPPVQDLALENNWLFSDGHCHRRKESFSSDSSLSTATSSLYADKSYRYEQFSDYGYICSFPGCKGKFNRKYGLKSHMDIHKKEKKHVCQERHCTSAFKRKHDLTRHAKIHSNYRPYSCKRCHKSFPRSDALSSHYRTRNACSNRN